MSVELIMPKAGLTMIEGTVGQWKAEEGTFVKKDDPVLEIENEKTTMDVEAKADGILHIAAQSGSVVAVGGIIGYIFESQEEYGAFTAAGDAPKEEAGDGPKQKTGNEPKAQVSPQSPEPPAEKGGRVRATGLARKLAREENIDLSAVRGSGPAGRVVAEDVRRFAAAAGAAGVPGCDGSLEQAEPGEVKRIPLSGIRRTIARNMQDSLQNIAQASASVEVDVTDLLALHRKLREKAEFSGCRITVNDLLAKATVQMLKKHPLANATFDGSEISSYSDVNLSVAVGAEAGLMVPVVKGADKMTLAQLSGAIRELAGRARTGSLVHGEQSGGTFTITNVGMYPIDAGTPVVNPPQVAIAGFGRSCKKPVIRNGEICARDMMNIFFTFDHRVFDGLEVGRILQDLKEYVENPELMLI
ncbi:dihydrolipoamide acetyltransferase family protein [Bacilliculturomica massiliensis]|uniref:dihydrolipoamide acetyltransferase family protein n=1 Tax=Bacilliculturomica massiliensis TaxID=1917867 RepID=UPI001FE99568|nr:dihydrolipoamide acetyltransferase family protein [Bacilliculturomica massiliensis]